MPKDSPLTEAQVAICGKMCAENTVLPCSWSCMFRSNKAIYGKMCELFMELFRYPGRRSFLFLFLDSS